MRPIPATVVLLIALLALVLPACGGDATIPPQPTAPPPQPTAALLLPTQPASPPTEDVTRRPATPESSPATPEATAGLEPPPGVVADVNGVPIPMADFQRRLADARAYLLSEGLIDPDTEEGQAQLQALRIQVLDQLIDQALIAQAAERMDLTVSDDELEASISKIKVDLGSAEAFAQSLAANNLTEAEFQGLQRQQLLSRKLMDEITAEIPAEAEQVRARHILVESEEEAQRILAQLAGGADFAQLAQEHSIDETTKENGGDLGFFPRGVVLAEFEEAAFALEVGQRSGVVATPFGYHVIEVLERETRPIPDDIMEGLRQQRIINWLEAQRNQAEIRRYIEP